LKAAASGLARKKDRSQKDGARKISGSYLSDPIFLTFLFTIVEGLGWPAGKKKAKKWGQKYQARGETPLPLFAKTGQNRVNRKIL